MIVTAEILLPAAAFDATLAFFMSELQFRVEQISPADSPVTAALSGHGLRVRLDKHAGGAPGTLRIAVPANEVKPAITAPNGTRIEFVDADPPVAIPELRPELVVTRFAKDAAWHSGRAGLQYRDLIPSRLGGRFIASHIRITEGGPVPDYTHFHKIRVQMIHCVNGWIRVAYEDQGDAFVMQAGDCVLQPPRIRHRVMEASAGAAVVEIACPAEHETRADWSMPLPRPVGDLQRRYGGQLFVRHEAAKTPWSSWRVPGFEARDLGIGAATEGLAGARVLRAKGATAIPAATHDAEFQFFFLQQGRATLQCEGDHALQAGDACVIPAGKRFGFNAASPDLELLEVTLPALPAYR